MALPFMVRTHATAYLVVRSLLCVFAGFAIACGGADVSGKPTDLWAASVTVSPTSAEGPARAETGAGARPMSASPPKAGNPRVAATTADAPLALVYRGPAGCIDCSEPVAAVLAHSKYHFRVQYVGPSEEQDISDEVLAHATLYAQPGGLGSVAEAFAHLAVHSDRIQKFVKTGGHYLGICMGGYFAGFAPGFGLLPGDSDSYAHSPGASVTDDKEALVEVLWNGAPRNVFFQDGPFFTVDPHATRVDRVATYTSNGELAALAAPFGQGRIAVSGPHPEAPSAWYAEGGLSQASGLGLDLAEALIDALMR